MTIHATWRKGGEETRLRWSQSEGHSNGKKKELFGGVTHVSRMAVVTSWLGREGGVVVASGTAVVHTSLVWSHKRSSVGFVGDHAW